MKGSLIALVLLLLGGGLGYLLLQESYADLDRLESETTVALDAAAVAMVDATRRINELRAIRPNLPGIDEERAALQRQIDDQLDNLRALRGSRPTARDARSEFIRARQAARDAAQSLSAAARNLAERVVVVDEFTRSGQEFQRAVAVALQRVFERKKELEAQGTAIDPAIEQKIESMRRKRESLQDLARNLYAHASGTKRNDKDPPPDPASLRAQGRAIEVESEKLAKELAATYEELDRRGD